MEVWIVTGRNKKDGSVEIEVFTDEQRAHEAEVDGDYRRGEKVEYSMAGPFEVNEEKGSS